MSTLRKLERDRTQADLAAVSALLEQVTDQDVMLRLSLESRRDELREAIKAAGEAEPETTASAALFFGGRPVAGSRGIESEFGGTVVAKFQDLVAKVLARQGGELGQRGVVPNKGAATLHVTNIVRGSFGFLLEELEPQAQFVDTTLKGAVENASTLLNALAETDEERFQVAVEDLDERVLTTAREFFDILKQGGATFRLIAGDADKSFNAEAVARAVQRATYTKLDEVEDDLEGQIGGVLPDGHIFEFRFKRPKRGHSRQS